MILNISKKQITILAGLCQLNKNMYLYNKSNALLSFIIILLNILIPDIIHANESYIVSPNETCKDPCKCEKLDSDNMKTYYENGIKAIDEKEFDTSISEFKTGYCLTGKIIFKFWIGYSYQLKKDYNTAIKWYSGFLNEYDNLQKEDKLEYDTLYIFLRMYQECADEISIRSECVSIEEKPDEAKEIGRKVTENEIESINVIKNIEPASINKKRTSFILSIKNWPRHRKQAFGVAFGGALVSGTTGLLLAFNAENTIKSNAFNSFSEAKRLRKQALIFGGASDIILIGVGISVLVFYYRDTKINTSISSSGISFSVSY